MATNKETLQGALDRCEQGDFDVNEMFDELRIAASNPAQAGQWQADRTEIVERLCAILSQTSEIHGTVETASAITEYHQSVVAPLVSTLVHALIECNIELGRQAENAPRRAA